MWRGFFFAFAFCLCAATATADNWQASIYEDSAPGKLVGVDKKRRIFNFFEKQSPLRLRYSYPCVTGQLQGDKQQINDLRTPEGVYFVEYKIASGLDFKEYGGIAYTLNYPNPVDRLRGKTGHGIWIHSKGFELVPTRGCVAIDLQNIAEIGPHLLPGTPVVVAEELKSISGADDGALEELRKLMGDWSKAWEGRSERMFDFYDPDAYSRATENFTLFRQNKERLFRTVSFIKIFNRKIHALEGPGYWVTWSEQLYTASNLSTEGIRRLYWQKDDGGRFRIVGMEWTPRDVGMRADFQKGRLVAEAPSTVVSDATSEAPVAPRLDMPEQPVSDKAVPPSRPILDKTALQSGADSGPGLTASIAAMAKNLFSASEPLVPGRRQKEAPPEEILWGTGKAITASEPEKAADPVIDASQSETPATAEEDQAAPAAEPAKAQAAPDAVEKTQQADESILPDDLPALREAVASWHKAYRSNDAAIGSFYDQKKYNRLGKYGIPKSPSLAVLSQGFKRDMSQPWLEIVARPDDFEIHGAIAKSRTGMMFISPAGLRQGVQSLWWRKDGKGGFKIVGSEFRPQSLGLEANYLENISGDISAMLEKWRKAWENGSLDEYISFYAADATQQGKTGLKGIRRQKEELWSRVKPATVQLSGLRLVLENRGIRADMTQYYSDSSGRWDKGVKTLILCYDGKNWHIQREDWTNLAAPPAK